MCTFLRFFTDDKNSKKGQSGGIQTAKHTKKWLKLSILTY